MWEESGVVGIGVERLAGVRSGQRGMYVHLIYQMLVEL